MPNPQKIARRSWPSASTMRRHFWQPPRAHGDAIEGRAVSFLELFYDLVYVVVVAQAAHHFAGDVTWAGAGQFAIVFGLIWFAWINGTVYHDLHGRSDARTRFYVFFQMGVLVLLAIFTGEATSGDGSAFATVYSAYLLLLGWLWYSVRRQDDPAFRSTTTPYLVGILGSASAVGASALLPDGPRLAIWAILVVFWIAGLSVLQMRNRASGAPSANVSESMIERFDLFTIIVLGEVIVGVVNGIAEAGRTPVAIVTGMLGLGIGFAYWWTYFDFVGGRRVSADRGASSRWLVGHFLVTLSIAATGGVMVSMIENASEGHASPLEAMVLSLSVAVGALALVLVATSLADWRELAPIYRPAASALGVAAGVALLIGWLAPPPWLQILLLTLVLGVVWLYSILTRFVITHRED
jgi:low temperature requirement protein LtrA